MGMSGRAPAVRRLALLLALATPAAATEPPVTLLASGPGPATVALVRLAPQP